MVSIGAKAVRLDEPANRSVPKDGTIHVRFKTLCPSSEHDNCSNSKHRNPSPLILQKQLAQDVAVLNPGEAGGAQ